MSTQRFELNSQRIEALPVVNHFLKRLRLETLLQGGLAACDGRCKIPPARTLLALLRNLVLGRSPLYSLPEWAAGIAPQALGLSAPQKAALNDDRLGRALDELFDADRQALLTEFVIHMVKEFGIDLSQLHNDSTSLSFHGGYRQGDGSRVRGKPTPRITFGYSKDHRPDLKQLLWVLTVSHDGAVPVCFKVTDGNVEDSSTHVENWNLLRQLVASPDFLYIADSKLCTPPVLRHIDGQGGSFLAPMPRSRREDALFREWLCGHAPQWEQVGQLQRPGKAAEAIQALESPVAEANGFRLVWFWSARKVRRDARIRQDALRRADHGLSRLKAKLEGPRCRFKRLKTVARAVESVLKQTGTTAWIDYQAQPKIEVILSEEKRTNPKRAPRLRRFVRSRFMLTWTLNLKRIHDDSLADGVRAFVTNRHDLSAWAIFSAYHANQALLETRHDLLKNTLRVTPACLHSVSRLDALLFLQYLALTVYALIERELRRAMARNRIRHLPLYPEGRQCQAPTAARLFKLFEHLEVHTLRLKGKPIQTFAPRLTPLQQDLLALLGIPKNAYLSNNQ